MSATTENAREGAALTAIYQNQCLSAHVLCVQPDVKSLLRTCECHYGVLPATANVVTAVSFIMEVATAGMAMATAIVAVRFWESPPSLAARPSRLAEADVPPRQGVTSPSPRHPRSSIILSDVDLP